MYDLIEPMFDRQIPIQQHHSFIISFTYVVFSIHYFFKEETNDRLSKKDSMTGDEATIRDWMKCSYSTIQFEKRLAVFPSPAGMSLTKLSLAGNNL